MVRVGAPPEFVAKSAAAPLLLARLDAGNDEAMCCVIRSMLGTLSSSEAAFEEEAQ